MPKDRESIGFPRKPKRATAARAEAVLEATREAALQVGRVTQLSGQPPRDRAPAQALRRGGRSVHGVVMPARSPVAQPEAVAAYLDAAAEPARSRLRALAAVVRAEAPEAVERMAYGLATWHLGQNLVHLGAFKEHVGIYPGAAAIVAFEAELTAFKTSKGAIQVAHDVPLPSDLLRRIVRWRMEQVAGGAKRATS